MKEEGVLYKEIIILNNFLQLLVLPGHIGSLIPCQEAGKVAERAEVRKVEKYR